MRNKLIFFLFIFSIFLLAFCNTNHSRSNDKVNSTYLNLSDSAKYVGIETCKLCHQDIYNTFIQTGMGKSFDVASRQKSSAIVDSETLVYDSYSDFHYQPIWKNENYFMKEYRLLGKDTSYKRLEKVDFIIGSGQHTNSHIFNNNGYLHQMPLTFYTQLKKWDLPPGFENGSNTRFSRKIGLECMSCHNAYPAFVMGSENKYSYVPNGINCERCHGPGSIHVEQKSKGEIVDTSKYIDYSIVNPAKLPIDLQFDVCQRCHLQGNAVLKENKSFFDFKPGMHLNDVFTVFMPRYENGEKEFIMASHADRLKMSACFIKSEKLKNEQSLKPYKGALTCITCHNPHISVKNTDKEIFNNQCKNCHGSVSKMNCSEHESARLIKQNNCISCHMPKSGSIDIPHVSITDHFIRRPIAKNEQENIKRFIGLVAVNEKNPSKEVIAKAYLNQYEKFDYKEYLIDSALSFISDKSQLDIENNLSQLVRAYFLKTNYIQVVEYIEKLTIPITLKRLKQKSYSNEDAWTSYRIGESYYKLGRANEALLFYQRANQLAPFVIDFANKLAACMIYLNRYDEAKKVLENIIKEDDYSAIAFCNLGYLEILMNNDIQAELYYSKALALDPDYEQAWINKAGLYIYQKKYKEAKAWLNSLIKKFPKNKQAKSLLLQLKSI